MSFSGHRKPADQQRRAAAARAGSEAELQVAAHGFDALEQLEEVAGHRDLLDRPAHCAALDQRAARAE